MGSLYHDDVIDEASSRRGVESVNARWGNLVAILAGDFLLAKASEIAASLGTEVVRVLANAIGRLCQGEMTQLHDSFSTSRTEDSYLDAIACKTASLLSASTRIGAIVAGADRSDVESLTSFGHAFGMAFQIWDDVRDLVCTEAELGKPAGHDMLEGTYTLPVIRALADPVSGTRTLCPLGPAPRRPRARQGPQYDPGHRRRQGVDCRGPALGRCGGQGARRDASPHRFTVRRPGPRPEQQRRWARGSARASRPRRPRSPPLRRPRRTGRLAYCRLWYRPLRVLAEEFWPLRVLAAKSSGRKSTGD